LFYVAQKRIFQIGTSSLGRKKGGNTTKKEKNDMRVSEGVPFGRIAELYNPEMFQEHETVIVFTRDDINRTYTSIMTQIDYINKIDSHLDRSEEWKLIGYWPKIMQGVQRINMNMDLIFKKEPIQSYLDAYLYSNSQSPQKNVEVSEKEAITAINASNLNFLY
jgi:hypothetical protein